MKGNNKYSDNTLDFVKTINELVNRSAILFKDKPAVKFIDENDKVIEKSYIQFKNDIDAISSFFQQLLCEGSNVAIIGNISYEWLVGYYAILSSALVAVPINVGLEKEDVSSIIRRTKIQLVIYSKEVESKIDKNLGINYLMLEESSNCNSVSEIIKNKKNAKLLSRNISEDTIATIVYTSGTTGQSKGVILTHGNLCNNVVFASSLVLDAPEKTGTVPILPLHHMFEITTNIQGPIYDGYPICIGKNPKYILETIEKFKPSILVVVPSVLYMFHKKIWMLARQEKKDEELRYKNIISKQLREKGIDVRKELFENIHALFGGNLTTIISGGASIDSDIISEFCDFGLTVLNGYGITECSPAVCCNRYTDIRLGSVGKIEEAFCKVKIVNEEIWVSGKNVMKGYFEDEQGTKEVLSDEYFKTGDIGYIDDGYLYITGRKKNLIILDNGENVSPEELENIYGKINGVLEILVCSKTNQYNKEQITAVIFPNTEFFEAEGISDVLGYLEREFSKINETLPEFKQIRVIELREEPFPKTALGKIKRTT